MAGADRWRDNWLAVSPSGAVRVHLRRPRAERREDERAIRALPPGTPVVLSASGLAAGRRCRGVAARTGLVLERQFLAVPSVAAPAYLVEDAREPMSVFLRTVLVTPPGVPLARAVDVVLAMVRALSGLRLVRSCAPGRLVVGRTR